MRRQEPTRHRAGGSILPHKPGNWQTADGQVHFPSGVIALRYGEGDAISRRGRAGCGLFHGGGVTPPGRRGSEHMAA